LHSHIDIPFVTRDGVNYEWQAFHAGDFVVQNTLVCVGHFLPLLFHAELPKSGRFVARDLNVCRIPFVESGCRGNTLEGCFKWKFNEHALL